MTQSFLFALGLHLEIASEYFKQMSIGNRKHSDKLQEAVKATQVYTTILEYNESGETFLEKEDLDKIFRKLKQVFFSVKFTNYE